MPAVSPPLLPIATCWWCLVILLLPAQALTQLDANTEKASLAGQAFPQLSLDGSPLNHLLLDPRSGQLYVGAVNHLHHLSSDLQVLSSSQTGPKLDSPECLPPIVSKDCPSARLTPNTNKILLLEEGVAGGRRLIVCGTLFQGICDKRSLGNVSEILYQTSNPVDTQYVAANDPRVSTVGVVLNQNGVGLMLVGRGYTSKGPSDIPPITTRRLASSSSPARQAFSQDEELGKLVVGSYSEYNNYFISAFSHSDHVYFLFSRRDVWHRKEYRTYVSRLCAGDRSFYSYVEVPLECSGGYNLAQGATLAEHQGQPALFVAMAAGQASTPSATDRSALCVYGISELDEALQRAQELCYTEGGRGGDGKEEAYIEYEVSSKCLRLPKVPRYIEYPCGGEHTPSPIASAVALSANPSLTRDVQLTAVTTVTEAGHTIALLGDKKGWLHKVFLQPNRTGMLYQSVLVDQNSPVNADLLLDQSKQNVYVSMVPVSECELQTDCQSCLSVRDPYCGWCVLEGRCLRRQDCHLESQANHWLWSYQPASQCVTVQSLKPANQSREEQTPLPTLSEDESLSCSFGTLPPQPAVVAGTTITCQSPLPELLPPNPPGSGRCMACVGSVWPCNWCALDELCTHNSNCPKEHIISNSLQTDTTYITLPTQQTDTTYITLPTQQTDTTYFTLPTQQTDTTYITLPTQQTDTTYITLPTQQTDTTYITLPTQQTDTTYITLPTQQTDTTYITLPTQQTDTTYITLPTQQTDTTYITLPTQQTDTTYITLPTQQTDTTYITLPTQQTDTTYITLPTQQTDTTYITLPTQQTDTTYITLPTQQTDTTYITLPTQQTDTTYIPLPTQQTDTTYITLPTQQTDTTYITLPTQQTDTTYITLPTQQTDTTYIPLPTQQTDTTFITLPTQQTDTTFITLPTQQTDTTYITLPTQQTDTTFITLPTQQTDTTYIPLPTQQTDTTFITLPTQQTDTTCITLPTQQTDTTCITLPTQQTDTTYISLPTQQTVCVCILTSVCVSSTVQLYDCAVGQSDCSQCRAVSSEYGCVWCGGESPGCVYNLSCTSPPGPVQTCPAPQITQIQPVSGPVEGGVLVTIHGSNLGMHYQDIQGGVTVAGVSCQPQPQGYIISTRIVCELKPSRQETEGPVIVTVGDSEPGQSLQTFTYQDPQLSSIIPDKGPVSGGTTLTIHGTQLLTGQRKDLTAYVGQQPCHMLVTSSDTSGSLCGPSNQTGEVSVSVLFGKAERIVPGKRFCYMEDPVITDAFPAESFYEGGRGIKVTGRNLDVVQQPMISVWVEPMENTLVRRRRYARLSARNNQVFNSTTPKERCSVVSPTEMTCVTPGVTSHSKVMGVGFELDNVKVAFKSVTGKPFSYFPNPVLYALNRDAPETPYRFKPGGVIAVEGKDLTRAMTRGEVVARLGDQRCEVKTLDSTHLYCEPPETQPESLGDNQLPSLRVIMGKLDVDLGLVQYDADGLPPVPLAAQVGLAVGAAVVVLVVLVIILMYRRKSKQALRDYKKVLVQLETLEINVGDQCRKEFTDLMTEMMDLSSDVGGPGIPLLDYKTYAERVFFPGQRGAPLSQNLDLPESRRQTVEQGLGQLNNLLNNRLFLIRFIHTLEAQQNFSQRDRGHVASLLTMALHDKLEYFTDVMKTLLGDLTQQYVAKNPKLMLRRTETVVEKMLTNWMSICLYSFLKEVAGEPLYMLYRAIKYQVDKGPVDAVTGKAKRTLNDSHLLREDIDYCSITLTVLVKNGVEVQPCPVKVLDTDTITQVKDKILDQIYKGAPFSQRPAADSLDLEWRSGQAGHLTLSDDDVTAIVQGRWKKLNTLQHYKVPDEATVALIPRSAVVTGIHQVYQTGEKTPMLEGEEEEGLRLWHLVKSSEDPEIPKHRKSSMRERERAKAIPEIYLTRLLSMKGTLQKFVDDVFVAILSTKRPPPIAVRFFFDFLDDMAEKHGIDDPETVHIWKTNSLPLRFWVNILKNPQFVFDVQVTDSVDAVLSVIAQTFIDSCTTSEHKVGRDSPVNKLLYAREIPRYKQLVERYYSDIHSAASGCYQEMNSTLTELSGVSGDLNFLVALHELYKYINKYYDQIIMSLEEDAAGQKMQLAYRLQQVAALVENKVTDL
uniref:Plexin-B1 n=2 Tax=Clupeocephala TaxID=186625 RepID=A0A6Q2ZFD6_ESOLU